MNPLTAPARVIAALPGVDASRLQSFLQMRRKFPTDATRLVANVGIGATIFGGEKAAGRVGSSHGEAYANGFAQAARAVMVPTPEDRSALSSSGLDSATIPLAGMTGRFMGCRWERSGDGGSKYSLPCCLLGARYGEAGAR